MNLVFLSPHYPPHFKYFSYALKKNGVDVFAITDVPDEALDPSLRACFSGHYRVDRLEDKEQVMNAVEFFENSFGKMDRVESHLEPWLEMEAEIRQRFGIFGVKPEELRFMKRKSKMHDVFVAAGVPCAKGVVVENIEQCQEFIKKVKYPVFIKPDIGVGATDTHTIRNLSDLETFFENKQDYDYYMEEYVVGTIESYDGLTDHEGNPVFETSHIFNMDIHNLLVKSSSCTYYSQRDIPEELLKYGRAIVKEINVPEKFFHIEFFKCNGKYQALEINLRPPGGVSTHMFNYACDIDVYDWWASIVNGADPVREYERKYYCGFIGRKYDGRRYKYSHDYLVDKWGKYIVDSFPMNPLEYLVMGHWGYLIRAEKQDDILRITKDFVMEE